jgi:hypothetical protein
MGLPLMEKILVDRAGASQCVHRGFQDLHLTVAREAQFLPTAEGKAVGELDAAVDFFVHDEDLRLGDRVLADLDADHR